MSNNPPFPSPLPLEDAQKNAELSAEESVPHTEKTVTKVKSADDEFKELAKKKGYIKKIDLISLPLKEAISDYFAVVISALVLFITSAVPEPTANWNFSPFSIMSLVKSMIVALPILINAWRRNGKKEPLPAFTTEPII